MCQAELTSERVLQQARAAEVVHKETRGMQVMRREAEKFPLDGDTNTVYSKVACYGCGKQDYSATDCKFKTAKYVPHMLKDRTFD